MVDGRIHNGGARPNAGRKPKEITLLRRKKLGEAEADAEYALNLHIEIMQDESRPPELRLDCGREVMDRVWGKAKQRQEQTLDATHKHEIKFPGWAKDELSGLRELARQAITARTAGN